MDHIKLLGRTVWIELKAGGEFWFKVTGAGREYISGFDIEGMDIAININDINRVIENKR
jgi:hypothetical protein